MGALGGAGVILVLIGMVIAVLWVLLPFAVFGIKDLAKELIAEQRKTNTLLTQFIDKDKQPQTTSEHTPRVL